MIPIRDTVPTKHYPLVNVTLIVINVVVFLLEPSRLADLQEFVFHYGLVPARYTVDAIAERYTFFQQAFSLLSFMFVHGGFWHLLGNMWFLYIFGDNVEDRLGPLRYLGFYLLCGISSGLLHGILNLHSTVPTVGASGAIAGVMGAYFILYPRSRVLTLVPLIIIPYFFEIPAAFFLALWFIIQFLSAFFGGAMGGGGVAWWAHVGGFVFGIILILLSGARSGGWKGDPLGRVVTRRKTPRLHVVRPSRGNGGLDVYGTIVITPAEARRGTKKLVNIPAGFQRRIFNVSIPPGIASGVTLRLAGTGGKDEEGRRGDAFLKVTVKE